MVLQVKMTKQVTQVLEAVNHVLHRGGLTVHPNAKTAYAQTSAAAGSCYDLINLLQTVEVRCVAISSMGRTPYARDMDLW